MLPSFDPGSYSGQSEIVRIFSQASGVVEGPNGYPVKSMVSHYLVVSLQTDDFVQQYCLLVQSPSIVFINLWYFFGAQLSTISSSTDILTSRYGCRGPSRYSVKSVVFK
ncbi:hypothetical protein BaRGS_00005825 [Batillaria attramentaria]|uniref:Uncharacterized protein n=1 Tax=Batillaria attramentaria TaxID=370345 RepID=A0ABD0LUX0_9CAEN